MRPETELFVRRLPGRLVSAAGLALGSLIVVSFALLVFALPLAALFVPWDMLPGFVPRDELGKFQMVSIVPILIIVAAAIVLGGGAKERNRLRIAELEERAAPGRRA